MLAGLTVGVAGAALAQPAAQRGARVTCAAGQAAGYACSNVDLMSFMPFTEMGLSAGGGYGKLNDIWGWTDPETGKEYALVGLINGTAFVDVSDPVNPRFLGRLPTHTTQSSWRDVKVYRDHAYIVSEAQGHGLQVFDLRRLRSVGSTPVTFTETAHYDRFGPAHNVFINEATGFAYAVGINGSQTIPPGYPNAQDCGPGLHVVDLSTPASPQFAGCVLDRASGFSTHPGYTHDVQCVLYRGPDAEHQGREICVGSNETAISVVDVTDKQAPRVLATRGYANSAYVHQGWFDEAQRYFYQDDELDESRGLVARTRTLIWDMADLDNPVLVKEHYGVEGAIDHNQYIVGRYLFQANYNSGVRILDLADPTELVEVGFFDTYVPNNSPGFQGAWSVYPFFKSGNVIISSIGEGLFVVRPGGPISLGGEAPAPPERFAVVSAFPNPFREAANVVLDVDTARDVRVAVYDVLGREVARLHEGPLAARRHVLRFEADLPSGTYFVRVVAGGAMQTLRLVHVR